MKSEDVTLRVRTRRTIRRWAPVAQTAYLLTVVILVFRAVTNWRHGNGIVLPLLGVIGVLALFRIATLAGRGIPWAAAVHAVAVGGGLIAVAWWLGQFAVEKMGGNPPSAVALLLSPLALWSAWNHVRLVHAYCRSGDRALLFSDCLSEGNRRVRWRQYLSWWQHAEAARRWRAASWMVAAGLAAVVSLFAFTSLSVRAVSDMSPGDQRSFLEQYGGVTSFMAAVGIGYFLGRYGLRYLAPTAAEATRNDQRARILFLRSFADDGAPIQREIDVRLGLCTLLRKRLDEFLEECLCAFGPVTAIAPPSQKHPPLGASREWVAKPDGVDEREDDAWISLVERRIRESQLVVAVLGATNGVVEEFEAIRRLDAIDRLIVVIPPHLGPRQVAQRWAKLPAVFRADDLPSNAMVVFWDRATMRVLTASRLKRDVGGYRIALTRFFHERSAGIGGAFTSAKVVRN